MPERRAKKTSTLVFLPGLDGTEILFQPLLESLPDSFRSQVVCFPSCGSSDYDDLLKLARDAVADIPEFHIVAWSFSGPLALMLAASEADRVRGIVLFSSFVRVPLRLLSLFGFAAVAPAVWTVRGCRRIPLWIRYRPSDSFRRAKADLWRRVDARMLAARLRSIIKVDAREHLRRCQAPILYIAGSYDRVVPRRNADEIVRVKPSVQVWKINGGHFAIYQNPRAAAAAISHFILNDCAVPSRHSSRKVDKSLYKAVPHIKT